MKQITIQDLDLEIYGPWYTPWWHRWELQISLAILVLVLMAAVFWWLKKYGRSKIKPLTVAEQAQQALAKLRVEIEQLAPEQTAEFYHRLLLILKNYLQARFAWSAQAVTDEELWQFLGQQKLEPVCLALLEPLLTQRTQLRFARQKFNSVLAAADIAQVWNFVVATQLNGVTEALTGDNSKNPVES